MERRVLIAIFLSFLVLYAYQALVVKPVPKPAATSATAPTAPGAGGTAAGTAAAAGAAAPAPEAAAPQATALVGETTERDIRVETPEIIALFTNRGARLKSWRLKKYLDHSGQPQELIETAVPSQPWPFTLATADAQVNSTINTVLYATGAEANIVSASGKTDLRFEYRDSAGLHVVKTFQLEPSYIVTFGASVMQGDRSLPSTILWGLALGDEGEIARGVQTAQGLLFHDGGAERLAASDITKQPVHEADFHYAGVDDNYFMAVALFPGASKVTYQAVTIPPPADSKDAARTLVAFSIAPTKSDVPVKFFVGPKDFELLSAIDRDVGRAINFGRFAVIVVPLLASLKWVNGFVGNWGWSIVILTAILSAIMSPLRHKQVVSMRKMQEIQPQVKAIQDRYAKLKASDPEKQKMNTEMMALYREKKVNPASGCLPMLATLPVLLAMWALLQTSIELRGAPWFGWIHDLSVHDPYYVLPVLMAGTQFWQQRMTPATGADPAQQKMMMFMPLVMGFIFLRLPAGALLYYVVSNSWGIGQQYLTNYLIGPPIVHQVRPAAERRVKRVGAGKTDAASRDESK